MTRVTGTWTAFAAAALVTLPASGLADTTQTTQSSPAALTQRAPSGTQDLQTAREHLNKASAALNDIDTASLDAKAQEQIAILKRRLNAVERIAGELSTAEAPAERSAAAGKVATEVGEINKTLTLVLGPAVTTGATEPRPTGTTGSEGRGALIVIDEPSRTKLTEFRGHVAAFAAAMALRQVAQGAAQTGEPEPQATTPPATTPQAAQQPGAQVDQAAARQHLTEARNTLSALTQLPGATRLAGDARTHVSQLISHFNELITAKSQWRASFDKVESNLTALIGPEPDARPSGTPGAVGTSGTGMADLDAEIRQKLVEFREQLNGFERAAGTTATAPDPGAAQAPAVTGTPPQTPPTAQPQPQGTTGTAVSQAEIVRRIAAIDALLKLQDESGGLTLTKTQVEELREHWNALRQALERR